MCFVVSKNINVIIYKNFRLCIVKQVLLNFSMDENRDELFLYCCSNNHPFLVEILLQNSQININTKDNQAIRWACRDGHLKVVQLLLNDKSNRIDPGTKRDWAIRYAVEYDHIEIVKLLLQDKRVNPGAKSNEALRTATEKGLEMIFELLLIHPQVDPSIRNNCCIRIASRNGHLGMVKSLLKILVLIQGKYFWLSF